MRGSTNATRRSPKNTPITDSTAYISTITCTKLLSWLFIAVVSNPPVPGMAYRLSITSEPDMMKRRSLGRYITSGITAFLKNVLFPYHALG